MDLRIAFTFAAILCTATNAQAQDVEITLNPMARQILGPELDLLEAELESLVETQVRALYGLADVKEFLRLSANAQNMSQKGLGADYASRPDGFLFGVALGAAADAGDADIEALQEAGLGEFDRALPVGTGAQISLMVGYNFSSAGIEGLTLYASGLYYPLEVSDLDGTFYNFAAHVQYRLLGPYGNEAVAEWGGIMLTSGLEVSRTRLSLSQPLVSQIPLAEGIDLRTRSEGTLELIQDALTIPIEATTDVRLLYFLSLYGGVGVDFQLGQAGLQLDLSSDLTADDPRAGGELDVGTAVLTVDEAGPPDTVMLRFLAGLQINIGPLKAFVQLNFLTEDLTIGLATGLRVVL